MASDGYQHPMQESNDAAGTPGSLNDQLFAISGHNRSAAEQLLASLSHYAQVHQPKLEDLAHTLENRHDQFLWRAAFRASSLGDVIKAIGRASSRPIHSAVSQPKIGLIFTGQGAQYCDMGRHLISRYPVFKESLRQADNCLISLGATWSVIEELLRDENSSRVTEPEFSMPICCALQIALIRLLRSWDITPTVVLGHSSGESAAAYASGSMDMRSALAAQYFLGLATASSQSIPGAMLAAGLGWDDAQIVASRVTEGKAVLACNNSPESVTFSGDASAIAQIEEILKGKGVFARKLRVKAAFHSHHMAQTAATYRRHLDGHLMQSSLQRTAHMVSSVTGDWCEANTNLGTQHWVNYMCQPVLFKQALTRLCTECPWDRKSEARGRAVDILVEIGPHNTLAGPIQQTLRSRELRDLTIAYAPSLMRDKNASRAMMDLAMTLWVRGCAVDIGAVNRPSPSIHVRSLSSFPPYPWNAGDLLQARETTETLDQLWLSLRLTLSGQEMAARRAMHCGATFLTRNALHEIEESPPQHTLPKYRACIDSLRAMLGSGTKAAATRDAHAKPGTDVLHTLMAGDAYGQALFAIGSELSSILRGSTSPSEILKQRNIDASAITLQSNSRTLHQLTRLLEHFVGVSPDCRILILGPTSPAFLELLSNLLWLQDPTAPARCGHLAFVDKSKARLDQNRARFQCLGFLASFHQAKAEHLDAGQIARDGLFDLIVSDQALHHFKDIDRALQQISPLLKPGSEFMFSEITQPSLEMYMHSGTLSSWYSGIEASRKDQPFLSISQWDAMLSRHGFAGINRSVRDCESDEFYSTHVITARKSISPAAEAPIDDIPARLWTYQAAQTLGIPGNPKSTCFNEQSQHSAASEHAAAAMARAIRTQLARLLMVPLDEIDVDMTLSAHGFDSLMAVDMRNWISKELSIDIDMADITREVPIRVLTEELASRKRG